MKQNIQCKGLHAVNQHNRIMTHTSTVTLTEEGGYIFQLHYKFQLQRPSKLNPH